MKKNESFLKRNDYKTWYVVHGEASDKVPLFVLHGGPGFPHNFKNNHSELAKDGYQVVLYDQLGCGLSDRPDDTSLWTVEFFIEELEALRKHLGFEQINIIGQSWGGSLAFEYALKYPNRVHKLIAHSPLVDTKLWVKEADKLKDLLPNGIGARMRMLEDANDTEGEEYKKISELFNDTFVLTTKPKPQDAIDGNNAAGLSVYNTMWGPSEAHATGVMKNWSVLDRLESIKHPTLLISGKFDEATPTQMKLIVDKINDIKWELFENSSHCANLEEPEKFLETVSSFLKS